MGGSKEQHQRYEQRSFELPGLARSARRLYTTQDLYALHQALEPFIDLTVLRRFVAERKDIYEALRVDKPPKELRAILEALTAILQPVDRDQVRSPSDIAGLLLVEMGHLDQEELRTVLLDTKNYVQEIVTVYRGSLNTSLVRVGELFKEAIRRNSAALIVAHNHPSSDPTPSPDDVLVTREIVSAGKLLDIEVLDHLVISHGRWVSMKERGMGFTR